MWIISLNVLTCKNLIEFYTLQEVCPLIFAINEILKG